MSFKENQRAVKDFEEANPNFRAANERADQVSKEAYFSEALRVIDNLKIEVVAMKFASRFKIDSIPSNSPYAPGNMNPNLTGKNEIEYARSNLQMKLEKLRNELIGVANGIKEVVMEIEASKTEDLEEQSKD